MGVLVRNSSQALFKSASGSIHSNIICLFASGSEICPISSCIVTFQAMEGGKQGQQVFKIGASGEAKLLFKSSTDSNHSVNNLFKKEENVCFIASGSKPRPITSCIVTLQAMATDRPTNRANIPLPQLSLLRRRKSATSFHCCHFHYHYSFKSTTGSHRKK